MSGYIKFGCWSDEELSFTITKDDIYTEGNIPPVTATKRDPRDTCNRIEVVWTNPDNNYTHALAIANDEVDQRISGKIRIKNISLLGILNGEFATRMAYRILAESMYRFTRYSFVLAYKNMALEVGDVGLLSDGFKIIDKKIRIINISETANGSRLQISAVEDMGYLYLDADYVPTPNLYEPPVTPELASPKVYFTENPVFPEINLHICPMTVYTNGWLVYYSLDDETYEYIGKVGIDPQTFANLEGVIDSDLPSWPTTIHRPNEFLRVEPSKTFYELQPITPDQFFNNVNLIKVEDEVIAFRDVVEDDEVFILKDLIRGLFNTEAVEHSQDETWHTLDISFNYTFPLSLIGRTIYFKCLSFYGSKVQQLEEVDPTTYIIRGLCSMPAPISITRIVGREGFTTHVTDDVDIRINLGSKVQGFNIGGFGICLFGAYSRDPQLASAGLEIWNQDHTTLVYSASELIGFDVESEYTKTITAAMRNGYNSILVSLTPGALVGADKREILINKV